MRYIKEYQKQEQENNIVVKYYNGETEIVPLSREEELQKTELRDARYVLQSENSLSTAIQHNITGLVWLACAGLSTSLWISSGEFQILAPISYINVLLQTACSYMRSNDGVIKTIPILPCLISRKNRLKKIRYFLKNQEVMEEYAARQKDNNLSREFDGTINTIDNISYKKLKRIVYAITGE